MPFAQIIMLWHLPAGAYSQSLAALTCVYGASHASKHLTDHTRPKEATMSSWWGNDNPQDWHTGKASHEQLALPDGGRITFWNRACCLFAERKSCQPTDSPFLYFPVCVPQSFKAASFIYNLFVLAVVCQCFFLRHFLPSAHLDQWFFS